MKEIRIILTDEEHEDLMQAKKALTWKQALLLIRKGERHDL
jgi:hypothetical protein